MSWCPSWSISLWQGWSCGLVHCSGGNATDPIWSVLASSDGISSWTLLNIVTLTLTLWPINSGVLTSLLLSHLSPSLTDSLPSLNLLCHSKTDARFMQDAPKAVWCIPYVSVAFFPSLKHNFIAYRSSKVSWRPDCIFEIHLLWQSGFNRVYSNCSCSCSFKAEIIKIGQSFHKMYSNNILNFQESATILNTCTKKSGNLLKALRIYWEREREERGERYWKALNFDRYEKDNRFHIYIYIYIYIYTNRFAWGGYDRGQIV